MQRSVPGNRKNDVILHWLAPFGQSAKLAGQMIQPQNLSAFQFAQYRSSLGWMGIGSLPLVGFSALFVSLALTIQTVIELQKFSAQDMSGAVISIGLLRELGPLTVSVAWCARIAARLTMEARDFTGSSSQFVSHFALPKYLAALSMSVPLGAYGLVIGFVTSALFAPYLGVSSTVDYLEGARHAIRDKDVFVYFFKLIIVNPTVGVFAGCVFGRFATGSRAAVCANAITAMFIAAMFANLIITYAVYMP
jgi:phospholipid/cholesterol/gamma-HCH transport system permease protein